MMYLEKHLPSVNYFYSNNLVSLSNRSYTKELCVSNQFKDVVQIDLHKNEVV